MSVLNHEALRLLEAAQGFVELGMYLDADAELDLIAPELRHRPELLEVRVKVFKGIGNWELMLIVASALARRDPSNVHWTVWHAFAARRALSIEAARAILLEAVERQPETAVFHYNLACYECQLGELEVAKARLRHATKLSDRYRSMALDDEDLKPIWDSLAK